jgi:hypothetical protein
MPVLRTSVRKRFTSRTEVRDTVKSILFIIKNHPPMRRNSDYLSEFEQEFELEFESDTLNEDNFELENDQFELNDEFELDSEFDSEYEDEFEYQDENSYESRLYEILNSNHESELEFENSLNEVLHEMEKDYFFKSIGKWVKNQGGVKGLLAKYGKKMPLMSAVNAVSAASRGDFRGALKSIAGNSLLKTGLSMIPGGGVAARGLDMANKFMKEADEPAVPMEKVKQIVAIGKDAYNNLARNLVEAQSPEEVKSMGKKAWQEAIQNIRNVVKRRKGSGKGGGSGTGMGAGSGTGMGTGMGASTGAGNGRKTTVPFPKGSVVHVYPDRVVIHKPS